MNKQEIKSESKRINDRITEIANERKILVAELHVIQIRCSILGHDRGTDGRCRDCGDYDCNSVVSFSGRD